MKNNSWFTVYMYVVYCKPTFIRNNFISQFVGNELFVGD